jgi:hypothetical protein
MILILAVGTAGEHLFTNIALVVAIFVLATA